MAVPPGLVLFDLGGVLIELRGVSPMADLAGIDDESELWRRWLGCRCVVDDWDLPVGPAEFLDNFASWPVGPFDGAERLVRQTGSTVPVGCLSNTNVLHWEGRAVHWPLMTRFAHRFVSHHMGAVKPDAEAFAHVADALSMPPDRVLLLDDNQLNVDGARAAGLRAERTAGVAGARRALEEAGVLRPADRV